jgi:hypothetical protein
VGPPLLNQDSSSFVFFALAVACTAACHSTAPKRVGTTGSVDASNDGGGALGGLEEAAAPPLPPDLDVRALERQLNCSGGRHGHACRILHEFGDASKGIGQVPSGQGRWMGKTYRVERGIEKVELEVLAASNVPSASVGPTDLPLRVAMAPLPKEKRRDGAKLAHALSRGDTVARTNKALPFVKGWTSDNGRIAMATDGPSVRLIAEEATYVRQAGQKVLVIKMKAAVPGVVATPGDGAYAELWAVTW